MNNFTNITATLDQPDLLENLVEKLATRRYDIGYSNETVPQNWEAVETSSTETYVSGTLSFSGSDDNDDAMVNVHGAVLCLKNASSLRRRGDAIARALILLQFVLRVASFPHFLFLSSIQLDCGPCIM